MNDGLAVSVRDGGQESVLWIHGYTLDSSIWSPIWDLLPGWRHVGVDLPGHGRSRPVRPNELMAELVRELFVIADRYRARHLIAMSMGGAIALQMGIVRPAAFDTLILSSPAVGGGPREPGAGARHAQLIRLYRDRGPGPWMTELWMKSPPDIFRAAAAHPQLWRSLRSAIDRHAWAELADGRFAGLLGAPWQIEAVSAIMADTLVLVGEQDIPAFRRTAELLRVRIPRCRRLYCANAGHLCLLEVPTALASTVTAHLRAGSG